MIRSELKFRDLFPRYATDLYPTVNYSEELCDTLERIRGEIRLLARERHALILAHYYERPEIQETADFVGDSLGLGLKARELLETRPDVKEIWLCAVRFMGDTIKVILGDRVSVFMPEFAGCSLVGSILGIDFDYRTDSAEEISRRLLVEQPRIHPVRKWVDEHPDGLVLSYMNSDLESKALSYAVFTSRNAQKVLEYVMRENPGKPIFMLPDQYLTELVLRRAKIYGSTVIRPELVEIFPGLCHVHKQKISPFVLDEAMANYPEADLLVHPECGCAVDCLIRAETGQLGSRKTFIASTQEMIDYAKRSDTARQFIVATETGHVYTLRKNVPDKQFMPVTPAATCEFMKSTTLDKLFKSMEENNSASYEVNVSEDIRKRALGAIERMLSIT
ncbi:quinolinate synthase NadA [Candidatus Jorgensenbacteria bacterium]|nr:quinolinate synthase NadA [Candidatus Jorgensenbacteria bacterium]